MGRESRVCGTQNLVHLYAIKQGRRCQEESGEVATCEVASSRLVAMRLQEWTCSD